MCLIVFSWKVVPGLPLIAAANRDEFYARPSAPANWWEDRPDIYAGRDLQNGGTWIGISRTGRFAAITNVRAPAERHENAPSRGGLVADFLSSKATAAEYIAQISVGANDYNGFNLLIHDGQDLVWYSNKGEADPRNGKPLPAGIYGLSNALLDVCWPKVVRTKAQFASLLCQGAPDETYFDMLTDTTIAGDCRLPSTGVGIEKERLLSSVFISSPDYGTRTSTLVKLHACGTAVLDERPVH
ncbi:NRDE family protein [Glaciimonas sp. Gout2]|uniref:NRDE family protein n=1 Tax=unclassified Glaciimonas TaxID=2644401 RepID=UPI002AB35810|nr:MULTISPECIES: NRDE family protein [unclassified Glaciimonas]MDY7547827.1 NRDE family protein [Glaciimonas sp. CA11.2]MEB0010001.1 NRDE family protein [Glaciimonas sp. Cout2]MEB0081884.1 NRDE family protein [Glaciimonas sp. Gout2]